jgi:hypothetical protein
MELTELLTSESVIADLRVTSKKQALQELARQMAGIAELHERAVFDVLIERERLGTPMGNCPTSIVSMVYSRVLKNRSIFTPSMISRSI